MNRKRFLKVFGFGSIGISIFSDSLFKKEQIKSDKERCKLIWDKLCGKIGEVYKTDAFTYVHPKEGVPNVLIYGDSISIAYSSKVRALLKGKATVFRLFKNGGSSHNFIANMDQLEQTMFYPNLENGWNFKWDCIHFNVGLHDLKYLKGKHLSKKGGKQVSSIHDYKSNLVKIFNYLKTKFPEVTLVFATTTPVPLNAKGRYKGDRILYNKAALEVLSKYPEIVINDLYSFTKPNVKEWAQEEGNVHYNQLGYQKQGEEVAKVIIKNIEFNN